MRRVLVITAVETEARAVRDGLGRCEDALVLAGGIGRTNAAAATTEAMIKQGSFDLVVSAGIAGALPGAKPLAIGDVVVATQCTYVEEGLIAPDGFRDMSAMGFPLGDFGGNVVPVCERAASMFGDGFHRGPIATVATCSGTAMAARMVVERTGAIAEAMEGAAVVHAARRLNVPGIEIRAISNTTGDRTDQQWDIAKALRALSQAFANLKNSIPLSLGERG